MGSKSGGGGMGGTSINYLPTVESQNASGTSTVSPAPTAANVYQQALAGAMGIAATPYQPYGGQQVAGFTPDTTAGFQGVRNMQGIQTPYIGQAGNLYEQSTNTWQNPYLPKAEGFYNQSFGYIPNAQMPAVQNYTTNALANAVNQQMPTAQNYFGQAMNLATNLELPTTREYYNQSFQAAANPYLNQAGDWMGQSVGLSNQENFNQQALSRYMNPYQQSVVDATLAQMKQNQDVLQNQNTANAIRQGAYGGSGQFMGQAELGRQQALANAQTLAGLNAQNYQQAMGQYNQQQQAAIQARQQAAQLMGQLGQSQAGLNVQALQNAAQTLGQLGQQQAGLQAGTASQAAQTMGQLGQGQAQLLSGAGLDAAKLFGQLGSQEAERGIQAYQNAAQNLGQLGQQQQQLGVTALQNAAQGVAGLGKQAQQAALTDAQALMAIGDQQRALEQAQLDKAYEQWQQARAYPYQQTSFLSGIAQGLGPSLGSTTSTQSSSSGTSIAPVMKQNTNTIGSILGAGTSILGALLPKKDGGRVSRADGGIMEEGFGSLMRKRPYNPNDDYISEAYKLLDVIPPAKEIAARKVLSELGLGRLKFDTPDIKGDTGSSSGDDIYTNIGNLGKTVASKYGSEIRDTLGSLGSSASSVFSADGGRIHKYDGGSTEARPRDDNSQAQQQAQQLLDLYKNTLGRNADQGGFGYWANQLKQGMPLEDVKRAFQSSPERMRNVREAYVDVLGRAPEGAGYKYWTDQAKGGMSFGDLLNSIQYSPESLYYNILGRAPDKEGFEFWSKNKPLGGDPTYNELDFLSSPEYQSKLASEAAEASKPASKVSKGWAALDPSGGLNKALAREKMIAPLAQPMSNYDMLLQQAMRRNPGPQLTPEQQGMPSMPDPNYYLQQLPTYNYYTQQPTPDWAGGTAVTGSKGAADENTAFLNSLYNRAFMRKPDPEGLAFWQKQMSEGMTPEAVRHQFDVSKEHLQTAPVQGYFSSIEDNQYNPSTGLFNIKYTAPYYGRPTPSNLQTGGRVGKAIGGGRSAVKLSMEDIARAALQAGATPHEAAMLTAIAMPESSGVANILNPNAKTGDESYGLWQINMLGKMGLERMRQFGLSSKSDLYDPVTNAKAALQLLRGKGGLGNWTTYTHGKYKPYYSQAASVVGKLSGNPDLINQPLPEVARTPVMTASVGAPRPSGYTNSYVEQPHRPGLLKRLVNALNPIGTAEAAESTPGVVASDESKPMFAWPTLRNPRINNLPDALGMNKPALPEWKKEVQTGFGPLQGERPADEAQLLAEPTKHERMGPEQEVPLPPRRPTGVVAEDEGAGKYWGDWRDTEPFASDPIGGFFDELTGDVKRSSKRGKITDEMAPYGGEGGGLGSLFGFAQGGIVRQHYAAGGGEDDFGNPLEELGAAIESGLGGLFGGGEKETAPSQPESGGLGDLLGSLFGGGEQRAPSGVVAQDTSPSYGGLSPLKQALISAGLGMMAASRPGSTVGEAIGRGGLTGFQVYSEAAEQQRKREEAAAQQRAAEAAAERYQRALTGEPPVAEDTGEEEVKPTKVSAPAEEAPTAPTPSTRAPATSAAPEILDIESDPTLNRLNSQLNRVIAIPAPKGMESYRSSQIANLKFQIEQRRHQLESQIKISEAKQKAAEATPEAQAEKKLREEETTALSKQIIGDQQAANQAEQRIRTLQRMREAVASDKFHTGALGETALELKKKLLPILPEGMIDEESIGLAEQFQKDALQSVTEALGGKLGAGVSDSDVRFLTRMQPGLGTTKKGNLLALDASIKLEQRKQEIAEFDRQFRKERPGATYQEYNQALSDWAKEHPLFPQEGKSVRAEDKGSSSDEYTPEERAAAREHLRRRREGKQ